MFWDRIAAVYDLFNDVYNAHADRQLKEVVAKLVAPSDSVLECGCGTGLITCAVAPRCKSLVATDFSAKMLERAKKKCASFNNMSYQQANILDLSFPDDSFDVVIAANVIHLLDDSPQALAELHRVCRSGGRIVIPTYLIREKTGQPNLIAKLLGVVGADFKQQFTFDSYQAFIDGAGYQGGEYHLIDGRIPCAVAILGKS